MAAAAPIPPAARPAGTLRVATYNVHGCVGADGVRSEQRIARVIEEMEADVVGLQELDHGRARSARIDQAGAIAEQLGWHRYFHPAMRHSEELYGDAIVSRHPIAVRRAAELPGSGVWYCREKRGAIWAEIDTPAGALQIINTHLGLGRGERLAQIRSLTGEEWLGALPKEGATILLGDFNCVPLSPTYALLTRHLQDARTLVEPRRACRTFPTRAPLITVDYIFVNRAVAPRCLAVHRSSLADIASDHYPLVGDFTIRAPAKGVLFAA